MRRMIDGPCLFALALCPLITASQALAQPALPVHHTLVEPGPQELSTLYATGEQVLVDTHTRWKLICGSDDASITRDEFLQIVEQTKTAAAPFADDGVASRGGVDIIFNVSGSVPSSAPAAIATVENYLEAQFSDPVTVSISLNFASLGGGVLGATGSQFASANYGSVRNGLIGGMDPTDTIQSSLPSGSTIPVRYNGASSSVVNENSISATRANYRATVGTVSGLAASMTINTNVSWDWDPSNGVGGRTCFQSVLVHEVGHALGFVSNADSGTSDMDMLDIYRFQRTDGSGDFNPDTLAEFSTTPRLVDFNTPDDDHNSDLISVEYAMSDGSPWQASHFREQSSNIGIMDPALAQGQTFHPNFFRSSDLNMLDAIGWDYPPVGSTPVPTAVDDTVTAMKNQALVIPHSLLLDNDVDPDNDNLFISAFTPPGAGTLLDNGDQTFTYRPNVGFVGSDSFTYTVSDDDGSDTASVFVSVLPAPSTYRVDQAAAGAATGLTWLDAMPTLDAALALAVEGDEIWVAEGLYRPGSAARDAGFTIPAGVNVYGGFPSGGGDGAFAARDPATLAAKTVLSGDLAGNDATGDRSDNLYHVVIMPPGDSVLDGFTITGGTADGPIGQDRGAGLLIENGSPALGNLRIIDNSASFIGGGIFASNASPTLFACEILGNSAPRGGGAAFSSGSVAAVNIVASGNSSTADGAALYLAAVDADIINATCVGNTATGSGGAIAATAGATVDLHNTILFDNDAGAGLSLSLASSATAAVSHSIVEGGEPGVFNSGGTLTWLAGNTESHPLLVDAQGADLQPGTGDEDFTPGPGSAAIDAGDNSAAIDVTTDLTGAPRRSDATNYDDTGTGMAPVIDIGAVEAPSETPLLAPCPCETDGNPGQVDVFDLLAYLDLWFAAHPGAERTGDSPASIDVFDLLGFLDCWFPASGGSPCP